MCKILIALSNIKGNAKLWFIKNTNVTHTVYYMIAPLPSACEWAVGTYQSDNES